MIRRRVEVVHASQPQRDADCVPFKAVFGTLPLAMGIYHLAASTLIH